MTTELPVEVLQLGTQLTASMARNGSAMIMDKIRAIRTSGRQEDVISGLEEIINDLQEDKRQLIQIAQAYQSELVSQQLAPGDIRYVADTLLPLLEQFFRASSEDTDLNADEEMDAAAEAKMQESLKQLELMRSLLSVETANVLQLLGFNFRRAIGEPLTALCESLILTQVSPPDDLQQQLQLASVRNQTALIELAADSQAYERFRSLMG
ncbi:hypothetical protein [uncultured Arthrobacter sp.]|uniref:hypothetical protein n=1 Tax=uncultured Arthrobacter sp. TaxID=114050 RepID=UPI002615AD79|nr:hypothetical protein [uncultured Arthrobacter sp.]